MLKADLHIHCKWDPEDKYIKDSAKDYIDYAAKLGFNVLSFTNHCDVFSTRSLQKYAIKKGIVLILGAEAKIEGKDVLLYNFTKNELSRIKTFKDLRAIKSAKHLVIAPHPFYPHFEINFKNRSIGKKLLENIDLFDGIEFCHFYTSYLTFNKKAVLIAKKYKLALVGNSDAHALNHIGTTYSLINAKPNVCDVIAAIKQRKVRVVSSPRSTLSFLKIFFSHLCCRATKNL
ncbi:MAG: PHP-associated domain-containing protein [Candidatus Woesearchaeota archaeon]